MARDSFTELAVADLGDSVSRTPYIIVSATLCRDSELGLILVGTPCF